MNNQKEVRKPSEKFAAMMDTLREEGKLFSCTVCGDERTNDLCLECDDRQIKENKS